MATVLCAFSAVPPFVYAEPTETVELNVGSENCTNDYYRIMDGYVDLRQRNVQYVLTGTTAKGIRIWGANTAETSAPHYIKLNNANVGGGIITYNVPSDLRIEVSANTVNTFGRINGNNIKISGSGTLNADINVIRQQNIYMACGLTVTDTTVNLGKADTNGNIILERSATWEGNIVIQGNATVKIVGEEKNTCFNNRTGFGARYVHYGQR